MASILIRKNLGTTVPLISASLVNKQNCLTLAHLSEDVKRAVFYRYEATIYKTKSKLLIDRNIFKDIISIANENLSRTRNKDIRKFAAALILFCQCAGILIEPNMAIHEDSSNYTQELRKFREVDNADPYYLMKIIHGEINYLPIEAFCKIDDYAIPEKVSSRLSGHQACEIAILKIYQLARENNLSPIERAKSFLSWSFSDYIFVREIILLSYKFFSRKAEKTIVKKANTTNTIKLRENVSNTTWDIMLIRSWVKKVHSQSNDNELNILASRDKALTNLSRLIVVPEDDEVEARQKQLMLQYWSPSEVVELHSLYLEVVDKINCKSRRSNKIGFENYRRVLQKNLENDLYTS